MSKQDNPFKVHTPAPWHFRCNAGEPNVEGHGEVFIQGPGNWPIAKMNHSTMAAAGNPFPNARLIAAAPELLAALEKIASGEGYYGAQAREYKEIARAAIKKARP